MIRPRILAFPLLLVLASAAPLGAQATPSDSARAYFDRAFALVRTHALQRDAVDWASLRSEAAAQLGGARTTAETYPAIGFLLQRLGDNRAALLPPDAAKARRAAESHAIPDDPEELGRVMPARVGMIILPPFVPSDPESASRFSNLVRDRLVELDPASCGWIVDLRSTSGGDVWPMLAGLGPLLGSGVVAFSNGRDGEATPWAYQRGLISEADTVVGSVFPPYELDQPDAPVAVLTGAGTRGAGEEIVVALRGRPNSRVFGETTGGAGVNVTSYDLSDGAALSLTTARLMDRGGRTYDGAIAPDVTMPGGGNPLNTQPIVAATAWMNSQSECRRR